MQHRFHFGLLILFFSMTACASSDATTTSTESIAPETGNEGCYCDVRKRKQVERRLQQKQQETE